MEESSTNRLLSLVLAFLAIVTILVLFVYSYRLKSIKKDVGLISIEENHLYEAQPVLQEPENKSNIKNTVLKKIPQKTADNIQIDINTANSIELTSLPGVGPKTADLIIKYRNENGRFKSFNDILNVSGIGESKLNNIKSYLLPLPELINNKHNVSRSVKQDDSKDEIKICPNCNIILKANNSRIKSYKPYCTNCLKYLNNK